MTHGRRNCGSGLESVSCNSAPDEGGSALDGGGGSDTLVDGGMGGRREKFAVDHVGDPFENLDDAARVLVSIVGLVACGTESATRQKVNACKASCHHDMYKQQRK